MADVSFCFYNTSNIYAFLKICVYIVKSNFESSESHEIIDILVEYLEESKATTLVRFCSIGSYISLDVIV